MEILFKIVGALGILLISAGIVIKKRAYQNIFFIMGGLCLEIYSIYIRDIIFIILQMIFILAAVFDLVKMRLKFIKNN